MSFEMKYDRDGQPLISKTSPQAPQPEPVVTEQQPLEQVMQAIEQPEPNESEVVETVQPEVSKQPSPLESFRELRAQKERAELEVQRVQRERDEAERIIKELRSSKQNNEVEPEVDTDLSIDTDDLVQGKHLSKIHKEMADLKKKVLAYQQQSQESSAEIKLKNEYPDIYQVVTNENIALLKAMEPELAATIGSAPDLYTKAVSTYKLIKKLSISGSDSSLHEKQALVRNAAKPRMAASVSPQQGDSPLSKANAFADGLTDELKLQLHKEMMSYRKNY